MDLSLILTHFQIQIEKSTNSSVYLLSQTFQIYLIWETHQSIFVYIYWKLYKLWSVLYVTVNLLFKIERLILEIV